MYVNSLGGRRNEAIKRCHKGVSLSLYIQFLDLTLNILYQLKKITKGTICV